MACVWFRLGCERSIHVHPTSVSVSPTVLDYALPALSQSQFERLCVSHEDTWVSQDSVIDISDPGVCLLRSVHFVMQTLFTVGFGDIHPITDSEYIFSLFSIVVASLFYAALISSLTSFLGNRDVTTKRSRGELETLMKYLVVRGIPKALQKRVKSYYEFVFTRSSGQSEEVVVANVPPRLRGRLMTEMGEQLLRTVPFFQRQQYQPFVARCIQLLQLRTYAPGSYLYKQHDKHRELLMLHSGRVELFVGRGESTNTNTNSTPPTNASRDSQEEEKGLGVGGADADISVSADEEKSALRGDRGGGENRIKPEVMPVSGGADSENKDKDKDKDKESGEKGPQVLSTLVAGDYTGDFQLLFGAAAETSARVANYTEVLVLTYVRSSY